MEDVSRRLKQIETENFIWLIYFFLIGLCLYANYNEKKYFYTNDACSKEKYRKLIIVIFSVAVVIYAYFLVDNYKDYKNSNKDDEVQNLNKLSLIGSALVFISGIIFLYIAIVDEDINVELAFN
jgi:uncharacterized membrane protein